MKLQLVLLLVFSILSVGFASKFGLPKSAIGKFKSSSSLSDSRRKAAQVDFEFQPETFLVADSKPAVAVPKSLKLLVGAGGIYGAFLYYGKLQEEVFHYTSASGEKFKAAWFLQALGELLILMDLLIYYTDIFIVVIN